MHIQRNAFNLISNNSEILTIQLLMQADPRLNFCFLPEKIFINDTGTSLRCVQKKPPRVSVHVPQWFLVTLCLLIYQLLQLQRLHKTEEDPEPVDEGNIQT